MSFNMFMIESLNDQFDAEIQTKIDQKTKPLGALGLLEKLAFQLAKIAHSVSAPTFATNLVINEPNLIIFAGDHGVAAQGVSIAPSEVTGQMVANFANGGAAISILARQFNWQLSVVDAGILTIPKTHPMIISQRLGNITQAIHTAPAMSTGQVIQGFELAKKLIKQKHQAGCNLIAFGEMGIGNTTIASALMSVIMSLPACETVGKGTGVSDDIVKQKIAIVEQALTFHHQQIYSTDQTIDPIALLSCLGGFEVVQMTGAILAAAECKMAIVIDGFISTAAAMVAILIAPKAKEYMFFAHCSGEQGHQKMLQWLQVEPLLNLGLRLGEGSGAALTLPIIQSAVAIYNNMASFEQAEVTNVV
jgi:nicotinate-nucleotide--dimethylbenzimidazole phosphoribosyltransferase